MAISAASGCETNKNRAFSENIIAFLEFISKMSLSCFHSASFVGSRNIDTRGGLLWLEK